MEPNDLLLFAHVADAGSFTRAAERVKLPKSTVSRRVAQLESELGERLLQRSTRRLLITEFGEKVLIHARQMLQEVELTQALAQHRQVLPSGRLRVSMPNDFAALALPEMLGRFIRDHPAVALDLDLTARRVDLIAEGYDLALRMGELPQDSLLAARRLATFKESLYAAPGYLAAHGAPQAPEDLGRLHGLVILTRNGDHRPWRLRRRSAAAGAPADAGTDADANWQLVFPGSHTRANSPEVLMSLALQGCGVATLSEAFVWPHLRTGQLVPVLPEWETEPSQAWAVFPERRLMPAKTRVFLEALSAELGRCRELEQARD